MWGQEFFNPTYWDAHDPALECPGLIANSESWLHILGVNTNWFFLAVGLGSRVAMAIIDNWRMNQQMRALSPSLYKHYI